MANWMHLWVGLGLLSGTAFGKVLEIKKMSEILPEITAETLVVFDLDNTVVQAKQMLGSDQWFEHVVKVKTEEAKARKMSPEEGKRFVLTQAVEGWLPFQRITEVEAVEASTPQLIADLQKKGIRTMGLTARPGELDQSTRQQLKSVGVDFRKGGSLPVKAKGFEKIPQVRWDEGVLFVGVGLDKGENLKKFMKENGLKENKVVFVDDKVKNVQSVDRAFEGSEITCLSYRYGGADEAVKNFDPRIAEIQKALLGKIPSDKIAKQILDTQQ